MHISIVLEVFGQIREEWMKFTMILSFLGNLVKVVLGGATKILHTLNGEDKSVCSTTAIIKDKLFACGMEASKVAYNISRVCTLYAATSEKCVPPLLSKLEALIKPDRNKNWLEINKHFQELARACEESEEAILGEAQKSNTDIKNIITEHIFHIETQITILPKPPYLVDIAQGGLRNQALLVRYEAEFAD